MRTGIMNRGFAAGILAAGLALAASAGRAGAGEAPATNWLGAAASLAAVEAPPAEAAKPKWTKPIPLSVSVDYTLVSDYIWRGVNLSEYRGEGRERPNHQMNVALSYDTGDFGSINAGFWFEWYSGQKQLTPGSDSDLQEVDYLLSWSYDVKAIATSVEVGWFAYQFPRSSGDLQTTYEWFIGLGFDDSKLFGTEEGVLNPTVKYYYDVDLVEGGQFLEFGISHDFALAKLGCDKTPILKDLTITPSATLGVDHRYFTSATQLSNLLYGLAFGYDLSGALGIPKRCGSLKLTGFLNYSQALGLKDDVSGCQDEFFGGVKVGYAW